MLEEMLDLLDGNLRQVFVAEHAVIALGELMRRHGDDLFVAAAVVLHLEHADGANVNDRAGHDRPRIGDQHVDRVAVVRQSVRHEAVIAGVAHRRIKEAVDDEGARRLVHLIFDRLAADLHLDDDIDVVGGIVADGDGVDSHACLCSFDPGLAGPRASGDK